MFAPIALVSVVQPTSASPIPPWPALMWNSVAIPSKSCGVKDVAALGQPVPASSITMMWPAAADGLSSTAVDYLKHHEA